MKSYRINHIALSFAAALILVIGLMLAMSSPAHAAGSVTYMDANGDQQTTESATSVTGSMTELSNGWYVVDSDVTISSRLTIQGNVHLVLKDGAKLTAEKGISVTGGRSLTVYGQYRNTGKLIATSNESNDAGIGGTWDDLSFGSVTINGGDIDAQGGDYAAGIGLGCGINNFDSININGGKVNARGGVAAAGIGGGGGTSGLIDHKIIVTINGGTVTAEGGTGAAGIGGGFNCTNVDVAVNGGTVTANGGPDGTIQPYAYTVRFSGNGIGLGYMVSDQALVPACSVTIGQGVTVYGGFYPDPTKDVTYNFQQLDYDYRYVKTKGNHIHRFVYEANDDTITATCIEDQDCELSGQTAVLSLNKTEFKYGEEITPTVTVSDGWTTSNKLVAPPKKADVIYVNQTGTPEYNSSTAPTAVGDYTAILPITHNINGVDTRYEARVDFKIERADNPAVVTENAAVKSGGNTLELAQYVNLKGAAGGVSYRIMGNDKGCTISGTQFKSGEEVGEVLVRVIVAEDDRYNQLESTIRVTISSRDQQTISAANVTATYGDTDKKVKATTDGDGTIKYAVKPGSEEYIDVDPNTGELTINKAGTATVVVTASATPNYDKATKEVTVTIGKRAPNVTAPTLTAVYGQILYDVDLYNPSDNMKGEWFWADSTKSVGNVGSHTFLADFIPDSENYDVKKNIPVTVIVEKAPNPATVERYGGVKKGGNTVDLGDYVHRNGATGDVKAVIDGNSLRCSVNGSILTSGNKTGSIDLLVRVGEDENYKASDPMRITIEINGKEPQNITTRDVTATYGDTGKKVRAATDGDGTISYEVDPDSEDYIDVDPSTGVLTIKKVPATGEAYVTVTASETPDYNKAVAFVTVTISKADNPAKVTGAATVMKNGKTVDLADYVDLKDAKGKVTYELSGEDKGCEVDDNILTSGSEKGKVTVNVTVAEDENYKASDPMSIKVTIDGKDTQKITASKVTATVGNKGRRVSAVTSGDGKLSYEVKEGGDYIDIDAATGELTLRKAGTAIVTVTASETEKYEEAAKDVVVTVLAPKEKASVPTPTPTQTPTPDKTVSTVKPVLVAKGIAKGSKSVNLSWNKVKDADRYVIYFAKCNIKGKEYTCKKIKTVNAKTLKWTKNKLKKNTEYKFYVVAQKKSGGNYKTIAKSNIGHFITGNVHGKYTNPKSLKLSKTALTLKKGKTAVIKSSISKVKKNKKLLLAGHAAKLRYISNKPAVATVNAKGKVTAKKKGTAVIYVQTINGIWKTCKITVK